MGSDSSIQTSLLLPADTPISERLCARSRRARLDYGFLGAILIVAFALRLAWRIHKGSADFWVNGYTFYYDFAESITSGGGFHDAGAIWLWRRPLYPLFLAVTALFGKHYLLIVVPQAIFGAGTVLCAYLLARDWFDSRAGMLAAAVVAIYPYYVIHDTAMQETSLFTFTTALATWLLSRAMRRESLFYWAAAGVSLAVAVLVRQTLAPFAACAILWAGVFGEGALVLRRRRFAILALASVIPMGCWIGRNYFGVGTRVTSEFGSQLWLGNNADTFSHYPAESIDLSAAAAFEALTPSEVRAIHALEADDTGESRWFENRAMVYIREHPMATLRGAFRKVGAAFSWRMSPARESLVQAVYFISYAPVTIVAMLGIWTARRGWKQHTLVYLNWISFAMVTAVFYGHTSHRAFLDVYMIVFAAGFLVVKLSKRPMMTADAKRWN